MDEIEGVILLPRLRVQNANAISGPLSWGFPPPSAFLGLMHALERKFADRLEQGFAGTGIVCHGFNPQVASVGYGRKIFNLTRNPLTKDGQTASFVEEGRAHMEVSLIIAVKDGLSGDDGEKQPGEGPDLAEEVMEAVQTMRIAGGSVLPQKRRDNYLPRFYAVPDNEEEQQKWFATFRRRLLPGFALVYRPDVLQENLTDLRKVEPDATLLDSLMDIARLNYSPDEPDPETGEKGWGQARRNDGWLVPLPVGYIGISSLLAAGEVPNARDETVPFRFVETLYGVGQWISPHRIERPQQLFWHYATEAEEGIYRCVNNYVAFKEENDQSIKEV